MGDRESQSAVLERAIARAVMAANDTAQLQAHWASLKAQLEQGEFERARASLLMAGSHMDGTVSVMKRLGADIATLIQGVSRGA